MKTILTANTLPQIIENIYRIDLNKGYTVDIKPPSRSNSQNRALHLYFTIISKELTNLGLTFNYSGVKGLNLEIPYTPEIVKNFIWRPIQISLFDIKSTTKLTTKQINDIIDVITLFFDQKSVKLEFPSIESLMFKNIKE